MGMENIIWDGEKTKKERGLYNNAPQIAIDFKIVAYKGACTKKISIYVILCK